MLKSFSAQKIIFDLDGTIIDTAGDLIGATNYILQQHGRDEVAFEYLNPYVSLGALKLMTLGFEVTGGAQSVDLQSLLPEFLAYYADNIAVHSKPYDGLQDLLNWLDTNEFTYGICTNKPIGLTQRLLNDLDLAHRFPVVLGGDSLPYKKPDPRHITETAGQLKGSGATIMIGDSATDINAAKNAGIPCIAVDFGYSEVPVTDLNPDHVISDLMEIAQLVKLSGE